MSGTTAQDGFIFQANAAVFLTVERLENGQKITCIRLEVRKPDPTDLRKNEYVVDIVIESEGSLGVVPLVVEFFEVKSGEVVIADLADIAENLSTCATNLYPRPSNVETFPQRLVTRYPVEAQILEEGSRRGIEIVTLEDHIDSDHAAFSSLEREIKEGIENILKKCLFTDMPLNLRSRILFSLFHLFQHEIKRLAQKLRENTDPAALESVDISLEKILNHEESFSDAIGNCNKTNREQGYDQFCEFVFERNVRPSPSLSPSPSAPPPLDVESAKEALKALGIGGSTDE